MSEDGGTGMVQRGYDVLSRHYRDDDAGEGEYAPWLTALKARIAANAPVLDLGCGCGVPVARSLAEAGHRVTGVDVSRVQIERARRLVPAATFRQADATQVQFPPNSFDAVVCLYALIHMPLEEQPRLLQRIAGWLRPSGWLLATTGWDAWTGTEDGWLGGPAAMWWSQADADTYDAWLRDAGLDVVSREFVPEGDSGHALFWARRPA
ncbi:class I SAM-dependent methyltransferase [Actinomadura decatromicini]|uniref:Class I SAM-dependent methyltransferase n=1 Tax=Actinomadura decatromicini TaxID=2604572 RepID=A0A5D3FWI6_9ACTN|nr:class I SAM-dependent methyltransferase [Actinomadura decatromicini]TYK52691.1 class I SAM-dependent methyltransferase [Actinomadura decatromicini]